jgi:hypothetical protein
MKRHASGENGRQIVRELSAHRFVVHHGNRIDAAEQAQRSPAPQPQEHSGKPTDDQFAALNTWEDEGGKTVAPAKVSLYGRQRHEAQEQ